MRQEDALKPSLMLQQKQAGLRGGCVAVVVGSHNITQLRWCYIADTRDW